MKYIYRLFLFMGVFLFLFRGSAEADLIAGTWNSDMAPHPDLGSWEIIYHGEPETGYIGSEVTSSGESPWGPWNSVGVITGQEVIGINIIPFDSMTIDVISSSENVTTFQFFDSNTYIWEGQTISIHTNTFDWNTTTLTFDYTGMLDGETVSYSEGLIYDITYVPTGYYATTIDSRYQEWFNADGQGGINIFTEMTIAPIPEPATMLLIGSGLIGLVGFRRRFRKS